MSMNAVQLEPPVEALLERMLRADSPLVDDVLTGPLRDFLARPGKKLRARLVELAWTLAGGQGAPPAELPLAIELLHAGSLIVDDIEDGSTERRGAPALHVRVGVPAALNAGNWLYFEALQLLSRWPHALQKAVALLARCHEGQALDIGVRISTLDQRDVPRVARSIAERKTGGLAALATTAAAVCAGAPPHLEATLASFGERLGVALQMLDDAGSICCDLRHDKGDEDLRNGRVTFAWAAVASSVTGGVYQPLRALAARVEQGKVSPATLRKVLRKHVDGIARDSARAELAAAVAAVGNPPSVHGLVETLEASYG